MGTDENYATVSASLGHNTNKDTTTTDLNRTTQI